MSDSEAEVDIIDLTQEAPEATSQLGRSWPRSRTPWRGGARQTTLDRTPTTSAEPQPGTPTRMFARRGRRGYRGPFRGGPGYMRPSTAAAAPTASAAPGPDSGVSPGGLALPPLLPADRQDYCQPAPSRPSTPPSDLTYRPLIPSVDIERLENEVIFEFLRQQFQEEAAGLAPGTFIAWKPNRLPLAQSLSSGLAAAGPAQHAAGPGPLLAPEALKREPQDSDQTLPDPEAAGLPPLLYPQNSDPGEPQA